MGRGGTVSLARLPLKRVAYEQEARLGRYQVGTGYRLSALPLMFAGGVGDPRARLN
jgi:hypothetical protein